VCQEMGRHHYSHVLKVNGFKIGISGFNSAWSCSGPEDDRSVWLAANWQFNTAKVNLVDSDIRIGFLPALNYLRTLRKLPVHGKFVLQAWCMHHETPAAPGTTIQRCEPDYPSKIAATPSPPAAQIEISVRPALPVLARCSASCLAALTTILAPVAAN
jgi:hypothetical protein